LLCASKILMIVLKISSCSFPAVTQTEFINPKSGWLGSLTIARTTSSCFEKKTLPQDLY
jgi:hypothetical protein